MSRPIACSAASQIRESTRKRLGIANEQELEQAQHRLGEYMATLRRWASDANEAESHETQHDTYNEGSNHEEGCHIH